MQPWDAAELEFNADTFSGVARLFPLPNLVLYPHVMQPLHIFEERYREMLEDALAGDKLIAMAVLEPGWETDYESRPPIAKYACLGKVVAHHRHAEPPRRGERVHRAVVPPGAGRRHAHLAAAQPLGLGVPAGGGGELLRRDVVELVVGDDHAPSSFGRAAARARSWGPLAG